MKIKYEVFWWEYNSSIGYACPYNSYKQATATVLRKLHAGFCSRIQFIIVNRPNIFSRFFSALAAGIWAGVFGQTEGYEKIEPPLIKK